MMDDEFRFVLTNDQIENLEISQTGAIDFNDYYLAREKRIREIIRSDDGSEGKFFMIEAKPGSIVKKKIEINEKEAKKNIKQAILIIEKKGFGHIHVGDASGYIERVKIFEKGSKKPLVDEVHIEFEEDFNKIDSLSKKIRPMKVIRTGLFDYLKSLKT